MTSNLLFDLQVKEVYFGKQFFSKETEIGEIMGLTEKNISVRIVRIKSNMPGTIQFLWMDLEKTRLLNLIFLLLTAGSLHW